MLNENDSQNQLQVLQQINNIYNTCYIIVMSKWEWVALTVNKPKNSP
mgnify:CR=1 FL=1